MNRAHHRILRRLGLQNLAYQLVYSGYLAYYYLYRLGKGNPLLVYQMGKVGSRTVVETLLSQDIQRPIYHVHYLTDQGLELDQIKANAIGRAYPGRPYFVGRYLQNYLKRHPQADLDVIVLTRDPVARNLSAFFHSSDYWCPQVQAFRDTRKSSREEFLKLKEAFLDKYDHQRALDWFKDELQEVFGIDVYRELFPRETGYRIYRNQHTRVLVIKLEVLNEKLPEALEEFLGRQIPGSSIISANQASEKTYQKIYQDFLEWLKLPEGYLDRMYSTQYARYFYDQAELARFKCKWLQSKDPTQTGFPRTAEAD